MTDDRKAIDIQIPDCSRSILRKDTVYRSSRR